MFSTSIRAAPARDTVDLLRAWIDLVRRLPLEELCAPTPARGRSLRNLTVNVVHPLELLPDAWVTGSFPWRPEEDELRESDLLSTEQVVSYAERVYERWSAFVSEVGAQLDRRSQRVSSPRGEIGWPTCSTSSAGMSRSTIASSWPCWTIADSPTHRRCRSTCSRGWGFPPRSSSWTDYTPAKRLIASGPPASLVVDQDPARSGGPDA